VFWNPEEYPDTTVVPYEHKTLETTKTAFEEILLCPILMVPLTFPDAVIQRCELCGVHIQEF
jgi:hypothetical protein